MSPETEGQNQNLEPQTSVGVTEYGFWVFVLVAVGRMGELVPGLSAVPLAKLSLGLALVSLFRNWKERPRVPDSVKPLASTMRWLFALAVILCPFSIWQGSSFHFLTQVLPILIATMLVGFYMFRSWNSVRGSLLALVVSGIVLVRAALAGFSGGRAATVTMYDTNDLAYVLVIVFPLAVAFAILARSTWKRLAYAVIAISFVIAILLTQSRGGLLGLLAGGALMTFIPTRPPHLSGVGTHVVRNRRFAAVVAAALVGIVAWPQLPQSARTRLATVLDLGSDYNLDPNDINGRSRIWARGWQAALKRPVGYGPDSFPIVDYKFGGKFNTAHNSFLLVLVETGFVGLLLFLRIYFLAWRGLIRTRHALLSQSHLSNESKERYVFAGALQCALAASIVAGFFLSMAWATLLWVLFTLCMTILACVTEPEECTAEATN